MSVDKVKYWSELAEYDIDTAEARYPDYKHSLAMMLNDGNSAEILEKTKELYLWIKNKL